MAAGQKFGLTKIQAMFMEVFGLSRGVSFSAILLISLVTIFAVFWFFHSAPPDTLTITSGPKGSIFETNAEKYAQ
ncbi:MAG: C4-dicarboxylate ABC transporter substrate-binding protein, partial [Thermodesulfobacteriota bacterium]